MESVPVVVSPKAAHLLEEWSMHHEFQAMLGWIRQNVRCLRAIRVNARADRLAVKMGMRIILWAQREPLPPGQVDLVELDWDIWKAQTIPFPLCRRFTMILTCHSHQEEDEAA
jgi:hypothetical protein